MSGTSPVAHTTENEIKFLNELGMFTGIDATKETLLEGYLVGAMRRSDWGAMDRTKVLHHARTLHANAGHP
ncbi:hypothetical protein SAMN05216428_101109 [Nitrosospira sp. Nsp11]|uniref:hypothetical protein n=1 Tax=Nitrosospira sp. Nsp11 TaxID=1855338 RepID=UPI000920C8D8|nr:hypothetical protein [Nitrosospira sp. Nsp11]SHL11155.1 hypothetical protein SAMN05216428_101109 [Nitrosospira sp. Nsp11]